MRECDGRGPTQAPVRSGGSTSSAPSAGRFSTRRSVNVAACGPAEARNPNQGVLITFPETNEGDRIAQISPRDRLDRVPLVAPPCDGRYQISNAIRDPRGPRVGISGTSDARSFTPLGKTFSRSTGYPRRPEHAAGDPAADTGRLGMREVDSGEGAQDTEDGPDVVVLARTSGN